MIQTVHMVCGVPGSGKSWVCEQLTEKFAYVKHDDYIDYKPHLRAVHTTSTERDFLAAIVNAATKDKPVLVDCPFGERELRRKIEALGLAVKPWFIVEPTEVVKSRYHARTGKELPKASVTRSVTILNRAEEWGAPHGKAVSVLEALRRV
jgi:gluconate kinase